MISFNTVINGFDVSAVYTDRFVNETAVPLLKTLTEQQQRSGKRILVFLAAPPAAGKSTLAAFLEHLSATVPGVLPVQAIGMDGFHMRQEYLTSHYIQRDGENILMSTIKGAPETFDVTNLTAKIIELKTKPVCLWPLYDRLLHNPIPDRIRVTADIVVLEGNYLLLDRPLWRDLKRAADQTVFITARAEQLRKRLLERKLVTVPDMEKAVDFVERSDLYNVRTILKESMPADLTLRFEDDGDYVRNA